MSKVYQREYFPVSVYGNVISLLRDHGIASGIHLDIGCGYGAIAEPIRDELGLTYVGLDLAEDGLKSLRERGFEVHRIDLLQTEEVEAAIRKAVQERRIASLTFLDTLEHLTNGRAVLEILRRLAERDGAPLVLSVPNVTHKDLALKLMIGRWDTTEAGLLDYTHVGFYNQRRLSRLAASVGWREIAAQDWLLEHSDQEFPLSASVLNPRLPVGSFLRRLIEQANPAVIVNQFVRLYQIDEPQALSLLEDRAEPSGPFLSVIITVREGQIERLRAILSSLSQQTNNDFEVLIIVYPCQEISRRKLDLAISRLPASFRQRVVLIACPREHRVHAVNMVLPNVSGRYVVVLRNDDSVEPNWCATFAQLAEQATGAVLRIGAIVDEQVHPRMNGERAELDAGEPVCAFGSGEIFPLPFEIPPSISNVAIPAGLFRDLGLRFDPELESAADWDLVAQAVILCGLSKSATAAVSFKGIHRGASSAESGLDADGAASRFLAKLNAHPLLLPIGAAEQIHANEAAFRAAKAILSLPLLRAFVTSHLPKLVEQVNPSHPWDLYGAASDGRPFLSVITRTLGKRIGTLRDVLMSLAGQSCQDFELLVVVHSEDVAAYRDVEALVAEFPPELRLRIRVLTCTRPGRSAPLNDALLEANGQYIAVLDDDDFVLGHWVETFQRLARESPGAMLRAVCVRQDFEKTRSANPDRPRAVSWFQVVWPANYDAIAHLHSNYSPFMSVAFPAAAFHCLGLRFEESLSTAEDWELQQRMAMLCGVATTPDVTSVYRWWTNAESSLFLHPSEEWAANRRRILQKLNSMPILLPPGATDRIATLIDQHEGLRSRVAKLTNTVRRIRKRRGPPRRRPDKLDADTDYDHRRYRARHARRIKPRIARRGIESSEKLGRHRWVVVERTLAWINRFRRLTIFNEIRGLRSSGRR